MEGTDMEQQACRHFQGLRFDGEKGCAIGRDIRAWAKRCNGGSELGIGLRLPCTKQTLSGEKPLFDCPQLDRKTQEEVDEQRAEAKKKIDEILDKMDELFAMKEKMIQNNLSKAVATCPWCKEKDALYLTVALKVNNHMHARCKKCDRGFME